MIGFSFVFIGSFSNVPKKQYLSEVADATHLSVSKKQPSSLAEKNLPKQDLRVDPLQANLTFSQEH